MNNARTNALALLLTSAVAGIGCSDGGSVDIGSTQAIGSQLTDYVATWDGYAEATSFAPDGSDSVRLIVDGSGQGTLQIGDAALFAPATDPDVGYPPGAYTTWNPPANPGVGVPTVLVQGYLYPIHDASVEVDRIRLGVDPNDLYTGWCPLQTPYPIDGAPDSYTCMNLLSGTMIAGDGNGACTVTMPDGTAQTIDCLKAALCLPPSSACVCAATGCTAGTIPDGTAVNQYPVEIDGALDSSGTILTGTLRLGLSGDGVTVVLKKQ